MTGTTSQHLRFHLLNSDATQAVVIGTWYSISQRLDIYVGINYIDPKNAQYNSNGQQVMTFEYFVLLKKDVSFGYHSRVAKPANDIFTLISIYRYTEIYDLSS